MHISSFTFKPLQRNFTHVSCWIFVVTLLCMVLMNGLNANAEALRDPTQMPANMVARDANGELSNNEIANAMTGPVLQSVMLGAQTRAAIINGKKVLLGKKYEQATLVSLSENEAILRNPDMTTQTLTMDYGVTKKTTSTKNPNAAKNKIKTAADQSTTHEIKHLSE